MSPSWVAPCYVYRSRKFSPGLKILLAAARQDRVWGEFFCESFAISHWSRGPDSYQNCVPAPDPATSTRARRSTMMLWRLGSVHTCSILSFMQSLTLIEKHIFIFLPHTLNFQSTVQNVATVFQSYNGREWFPELGIVHLNTSPECIISSPGTDQNSSMLHVGKFWDFIPFDIAEHEWEWVGLCEMRRLHSLSITGIYARIGLGLRLSRACSNKSDWMIRSRWFPGMQLNVRPTPLRLADSKRVIQSAYTFNNN